MTNFKSAEQLARAWIDGWNAGTPEQIPLSPDFAHTSPFGTVSGRERYLEWVRPLAAKNVTSLKIIRTLSHGDQCAIWFEMGTPNGAVAVCDWVETCDGQVTAITSFYDASHLPER
ncbi:MAG: nuclear transport factor 2 family protein, partial [Gammaproteobacteria bacterium]|nr:nuclear transport factor 2 family protein [Gammaproteobacteria bacterium]